MNYLLVNHIPYKNYGQVPDNFDKKYNIHFLFQ